MAAPPYYRPIDVSQLGDDVPEWFKRIAPNMNLFGQATQQALTQQLRLMDNFVATRFPATGQQTIKTLPTYSSANAFTPISFTWGYGALKKPDELRVGQFSRADNGPIYSAVQPIWTYNPSNDQITINYITGLSPSTTYNFTFFAQ